LPVTPTRTKLPIIWNRPKNNPFCLAGRNHRTNDMKTKSRAVDLWPSLTFPGNQLRRFLTLLVRPHLNAFKLSVSLLAVFAWLLAVNHCAVEMVEGGEPPHETHTTATAPASHSHSHGPGHDKDSQGDDSIVCCQDFSKAAQTDNASPQFKNVVVKLVTFFNVAQLLPVAPKANLNPHYLDSGPPASFAESVLQRSVLAHAPPVLS
ncbi:MAG: hypothetical protein ABIR29_09230, partial [Chthoniobacterales bacterium]